MHTYSEGPTYGVSFEVPIKTKSAFHTVQVRTTDGSCLLLSPWLLMATYLNRKVPDLMYRSASSEYFLPSLL